MPADSAKKIEGPVDVCQSTTNITYSVPPVPNATGYNWILPPGFSILSGSNTSQIVVGVGSTVSSGIITVNGTQCCGDGVPASLFVNVHDRPSPALNGSNTSCKGQTYTYTTYPGKSNYQWSFSSGAQVVSGGNTTENSATILWTTTGAQWVKVNYTDNNGCDALIPAQIDVDVNQGFSVSVSITASATSVCTGDQVTFTATPVNPGSSPAYQWKVNEVSWGSNSPVFSYVPANNDVVKCILISSLTSCVSGNPATSSSVTMTVGNMLPVSLSITASSNPVCAGTSVTFIANPSNGGTSPVYLWKVNAVSKGTSSSTFSYSPQNGDIVCCQLTSSLGCTTNNPATSNCITINLSPSPWVSFSSCFDTMTTITARPILLKGGIPLGGTYSGPGVNSSTGYFNPLVAGTGVKTISYSYINTGSCSDAKTLHLHVLAAPAFICGQALTDIRDGKTYTTVQLGSQCWMQKNLDYGSATSAVNHQQDNCISEKYCYNDDVTNCAKYGGSYQWDELMQFQDTPGLQGLCPPGWHVPTQAEWTTLFNYYQGQGIAGKPMQDTIINGFRAKQGGVIYSNASWKFQGFGAIFWTSTPSGTIKAISHGLNQINFSVSDYPANRSNAFEARCLRD